MKGGIIEQILAEVIALRAEVAELKRSRSDAAEMSIADYAARHAIGESTVRTAIREGRLAATRHGRSVRIAADAKIVSRRVNPGAIADRVLRVVGGGS